MENKQELDALKDIKLMMEKSSRFLSLSGWSAISAGICALIGSWLIFQLYQINCVGWSFAKALLITYGLTFTAALLSAFFFTYRRSSKTHTSIWGSTPRRLFFSVAVPFAAGAILVAKLILLGHFEVVHSACLIIYGMAILCGSNQTISEIKYLGYSEIILGVISLLFLQYGLIFWTLGFGILHILYGIIMLFRYERGK